jgi:hypothetical protein
MCDHNHRWRVLTDNEVDLPDDQSICPAGHVAVTAHRLDPADRVSVTLIPQALVADSVTASVVDDRLHMIRVTSSSGLTRDVGPLERDTALDWVRELLDCTAEDAWRKLDRLGRDA